MKKITKITLAFLLTIFLLISCGGEPTPRNNSVTGVTLNKDSITILEHESEILVATVLPENSTNNNVTWKSSDESIATVDANGKVTGISHGNAKITVTTEDGNKTATCDVTVNINAKYIPLTLKAKNAETIISFATGIDPISYDVFYSINGAEKVKITNWGDSINIPANGEISFYRTLNQDVEHSNHFTIVCNSDCYVYGNVMSLINKDDFSSLEAIPYEGAFCYLFYAENNKIINHDSLELLLPATELAKSCYEAMFSDCTSLKTAPALPATTLAVSCYATMFSGCTSLKTAPALPAETLAGYCYHNMFLGCESLTKAPELPAKTLAVYCYAGMFPGCTNLETAPVLPAKELVSNCYFGMFYGCISLNSITCLATTGIGENYSTKDWVSGVSSTGTFTKAAGVDWGEKGVSRIPSGWTVQDYPTN